jgi:predicted RND superfamily exporter protein
MAYAFKRAAKAIAVTSSTTSVAFFANAGSPLIPIKAFGIYASIMVIVNYGMVMFIMPSVQMIYENKVKHKEKCPCACGCSKKDNKQMD